MVNGYEYISEWISVTTPIDTAIIVAMISGAVAIIGLLGNTIMTFVIKRMEYRHSDAREKRQESREMREKMIEPYDKLVSFIFQLMSSVKQDKQMSEKELQKWIEGFNRAVVLYGSNKVIVKWGNFRINSLNPDPKKLMTELEELLYEIREDLGFEKEDMKKGDILKLFINDIETLIEEK